MALLRLSLRLVMATKIPVEVAFQRLQRHPRPQAANALGLSRKLDDAASVHSQQSPWNALDHIGDLIQGRYTWSLCLDHGSVSMIKRVRQEDGKGELRKVQRFMDHPNVTMIKQVFTVDDSMYFKYDYTRYSLEEVLCVHRKLGELHIQVIASSVSTLFKLQGIALY